MHHGKYRINHRDLSKLYYIVRFFSFSNFSIFFLINLIMSSRCGHCKALAPVRMFFSP